MNLPPLPKPHAVSNNLWYSRLYTADQLRARDLEVAKAVLEEAAKLCLDESAVAYYENERSMATYLERKIRAMEIKHE
jgi:ABC-type branched-subunit amino acid transport system ATPase component